MAHNSYFVGFTNPVPNGHVPDSTEYTLLWTQLYAAINGDAGGTWAPGAFITVGGSGFQLTGTGHEVAAAARLTVQSTGEIRVANGGLVLLDGSGSDIRLEVASNIPKITIGTTSLLDVFGAATIKGNGLLNVDNTGGIVLALGAELLGQSGSITQWDAGANAKLYGTFTVKSTGVITLESSGQLTTDSGSFVQFSGETDFAGTTKLIGGTWLQLNTRTWTRPGFDLISLTGGQSPDIYWLESIATNGPAAVTDLATATGDKSILRLLNLPIGGTLTSVTLTTQGFSGSGSTATFPTYRIVSWDDTSASGLTNLSSATADGHTTGNWTSTAVDTTVTANAGGFTIDATKNYGILITHPYDPSPSLGTQLVVFQCKAVGTATSMQL